MLSFDTCYSSQSLYETSEQQEGKMAHASGQNINAKDGKFHGIVGF